VSADGRRVGDDGDVLQPAAPALSALRRLLDEHAPLRPAPLCPELRVHQAHALVGIWEAAERLAGATLPAPFWAYPWAGGSALARVILDEPALVRGRAVLDFGAGGGIAALAAAYAGAARVVANDTDPWALRVTALAAAAQSLHIDPLTDDLCGAPALADAFDVLLCSDLAYERSQAGRQRSVLERAAARGATVLVADAGRAYFDAADMTQLGAFEVDVPHDLEGVPRRTARVYRLGGTRVVGEASDCK
jgi:predicted nicotinamide N-methyase